LFAGTTHSISAISIVRKQQAPTTTHLPKSIAVKFQSSLIQIYEKII